VIIDTGASVTIARPDIFAGQPERKPSRAYVLQTASEESIPVLKEVLVELTLEQRALRIWVFVAEVTDEFILGLDVLRDYDASVDLRRHLLRLGQEEVTLWRPGAQPKSARLSLVGDEVIPARCEGGNGKIRGTSGGNQRPHRTKPEVFPGRSAYPPGFSPSQAESICPHYECD
jgi:hypothetical protein